MVNHLPEVGRLQGICLYKQGSPEESYCTLQYTDRKDKELWHEVKIPLPDTLYLLDLLRALEKQHGLETIERPPQD